MTRMRRSAGFLATAKALSARNEQHEPSEGGPRSVTTMPALWIPSPEAAKPVLAW